MVNIIMKMAKVNTKTIWAEAGISLLTTIVILATVKYLTGKSILPESWVIVFLLILIYLRIVKK